MKVPKYIEKALERRAKAINDYMKADDILTKFIEKNEIDVPLEDYGLGAEAMTNPWESNISVKKCIENHKK